MISPRAKVIPAKPNLANDIHKSKVANVNIYSNEKGKPRNIIRVTSDSGDTHIEERRDNKMRYNPDKTSSKTPRYLKKTQTPDNQKTKTKNLPKW